MITTGDEYLLAILNSSVGDWYISQLGVVRSGGYFEYKPVFVRQLPVPLAPEATRLRLAGLVQQIMEGRKTQKDTSALERQVDQIAYSLYGLGPEEVDYLEERC